MATQTQTDNSANLVLAYNGKSVAASEVSVVNFQTNNFADAEDWVEAISGKTPAGGDDD